MTTWRLPDNCFMTAWWPPDDAQPDDAQPDDCMMTAWWLPDKCLTIAWWIIPYECLTNVWQLPDNCLTTAWQLHDNSMKRWNLQVCLNLQLESWEHLKKPRKLMFLSLIWISEHVQLLGKSIRFEKHVMQEVLRWYELDLTWTRSPDIWHLET